VASARRTQASKAFFDWGQRRVEGPGGVDAGLGAASGVRSRGPDALGWSGLCADRRRHHAWARPSSSPEDRSRPDRPSGRRPGRHAAAARRAGAGRGPRDRPGDVRRPNRPSRPDHGRRPIGGGPGGGPSSATATAAVVSVSTAAAIKARRLGCKRMRLLRWKCPWAGTSTVHVTLECRIPANVAGLTNARPCNAGMSEPPANVAGLMDDAAHKTLMFLVVPALLRRILAGRRETSNLLPRPDNRPR
jgi:hypothetical protein